MAPDDQGGGEDSGRYFSKVAGIALIVLSGVVLVGGGVLRVLGSFGFIEASVQSEAAVSALEADLDRLLSATLLWSGALLFVGVGVLLLARFPRERDRTGDEGTRPPAQRERDQSAVPTAMAAISDWRNSARLGRYRAGLVVVGVMATTTALVFTAATPRQSGWAFLVDTCAHIVGFGFAISVGIRNGNWGAPGLAMASPIVFLAVVLQGIGAYSFIDDLARSDANPIPAAHLAGTAVLALAVLLACSSRPWMGQALGSSAQPEHRTGTGAIDVATDGRQRAVIPDSREANAPTEDKNQASLERYLANLLQRRQLRVITETEYQTQLLRVRQLVAQRAEGAMTAREYEAAAGELIG